MPVVSLEGSDWFIGCVEGKAIDAAVDIVEVKEWLPATVPGNILADLYGAGKVPDPYFGDNLQASHWADRYDWWYKKSFRFSTKPGKRVHLVLNGVDYLSAVYLNGQLLGCQEGMFDRQVYEVTNLLKEENTLAVRIWGSGAYPKPELSLWGRLFKFVGETFTHLKLFPPRLGTLRCQMSFGWDFSPQSLSGGIWDSVYLDVSGGKRIEDMSVSTTVKQENANIGVTFVIDSNQESPVMAVIELKGVGFDSGKKTFHQEFAVPIGTSYHTFVISLENPRLWQPWDQGEPNLYCLSLILSEGDEITDSKEERFGIREVALEGELDQEAPWNLIVNGRPEFIRGANWVPVDFLYGKVKRDDYRELIKLAHAANINLLRVWGGGLREKKDFYDICDEEGVLVWQEFPFACSFFDHYPQSEQFQALVEKECSDIVRAIRNHPSLIMWCGGNEFNQFRNKELVGLMKRIVEELDRGRFFKPSSPSPGDRHNWRVWHGFGNVADYRREKAQVLSEFGLQAPPSMDSLRRFVSPSEVNDLGSAWEYHSAELGKLWRYAAVFQPESTEEFVDAAQRVQAIGLQTAIEHQRRRKGDARGVLFWQFNEPWPAISWSVVDYFRSPKRAYFTVRRSYSPVLISLAYPFRPYREGDRFQAEIWVVNDTQEELTDCYLEILLGGKLVYSQNTDSHPDSSTRIGEINLDLPCVGQMEVRLWRTGKVISENSYDLTYYDPRQASLRGAFTSWLTWKVLE